MNSSLSRKVLSDHYSRNRIKWEHFYTSERIVISSQGYTSKSVLDIGGACGGLGLVLKELYDVQNYVCIELDQLCCEVGKTLNSSTQFLCGDFLDLSKNELREQKFDFVFALSSLDWNVNFFELLDSDWFHVNPGGANLVLSNN